MKALLLTREYPPEVYGGAGVHVDHLARELARRIPVEVRTFGTQDLRDGRLRVRGYGAPGGTAPADGRSAMALQALRVSMGLAADPVDADVVHGHTWYAAFGGFLVRMLYRIPLVVTAHSLEPLRPWKREQLGPGADLSAWAERSALEAADAVVAVSGEMRDDILRHFRVAPERVAVIGNGVDTEGYRPTGAADALGRYGIDRSRPYVLFVGRVSRQKGILHLVRALRWLPREVQLVLCASTPDTAELAAKLATAVAEAGASRGGLIWIREMVDRPTVVQLYSHAAVFCCPSLYEPFGIINLEAMACEVPVVASAVGGIPGVVQDGETGLLVPVERLDQEGAFEPAQPEVFSRRLAEAIGALLADPARRRAMGVAGRRRAEALFSWRAVATQLLAVYEAAIARKGALRPSEAARLETGSREVPECPGA
jgi:glycogen synthase